MDVKEMDVMDGEKDDAEPRGAEQVDNVGNPVAGAADSGGL